LRTAARSHKTGTSSCNILADIAADQADNLLALTASASHVDIVDVADGNLGRIAGASRSRGLVALVDDDGQCDILDSEVLERNVLDVAVSPTGCGCCAGTAAESLDASAVLSVDHSDVLDKNVGDDVLHTGILAQRAHGDTVRTLAVEVLNKRVGGIGLEADTVISVDDVAVRDVNGIAAVDIPSVGVLCLLAARLDGVEADVIEGHVLGSIDQIVPKRTLHLVDVLDKYVLRIVDDPWDRSRLASLMHRQYNSRFVGLDIKFLSRRHTLYHVSPLPE
jgi:hypothetical protein